MQRRQRRHQRTRPRSDGRGDVLSSVEPPVVGRPFRRHGCAQMRVEAHGRSGFRKVFFHTPLPDLRVNHESATSAKLMTCASDSCRRSSSAARPAAWRAPRSSRRGPRPDTAGPGSRSSSTSPARRCSRRCRPWRGGCRRARTPSARCSASGVCGALTTFSTLQLEIVVLVHGGHGTLGGAYALGSIAAGLLTARAISALDRREPAS